VSRVPASNGESLPDQAPFQVRLGPGSGPAQTVVTVTGDVDTHSEGRLRDALTEAGAMPGCWVVLDLSGVEFMASAGVHVLLDVAGQLETGGGGLVLAGPRPMVARVLSLTRADELIPTVATVEEALTG
jgi:anti-anti-sigma factor